ncbi:hypothetical protein BRADI_4g29878v3 [Brachypodium distachyon]|uniref:SprT-like domain-containing protein n=1 Tax=Brachypodium distachyon TaxID=15368 RepID=A0A2K2CR79_BRADI|nr:hypothetical protein BRADI_4g29878v3 [Brachypodium distachyon]
MALVLADPDAVEENPDVWELFRHYDKLYFRGALDAAAFSVRWTSPHTKRIRCFGSCSFGEGNNIITLYEPMLKYRTNDDLKNTLLHLMIHAIIFVKHGGKCIWNHGPLFRDWMDAINACSIEDDLRPSSGYCITTTHDFSPETFCGIDGFLWKCESCSSTLMRAKKLSPPSDSCCIENFSEDGTCGNMLCYWHNHKMDCGGTYVLNKARDTPGQKKVPKASSGGRRLMTGKSEMSESQGTVQESYSDELQENGTVAKPNAQVKLPSLTGGTNTKSLGSSSSKKAGKRNMPEDFQKAIVLHAASLRKLKPLQEFAETEKRELLRVVGCNDAKSRGSISSKKAGKSNIPDDLQRADVLPASSCKKLKSKHEATEMHELFSTRSRSNAKSLDNSSLKKADQRNIPENFQKVIVSPAPTLGILKPEQTLVASQKHKILSLGSWNNEKSARSSISRKADKWHNPSNTEDVRKPSARPAASQKKLKVEQDSVALERRDFFSLGSYSNAKQPGSSMPRKANKWHKPEHVEKSSVPLAASPKQLKPEKDVTASEKHRVVSQGGYNNAKSPGSSTSMNAGKLHKPDEVEKSSVPLNAPSKKLELEQDLVASEKHMVLPLRGCGNVKPPGSSTSRKAGKLHNPQDTEKTSALPAAPQKKLELVQDSVALKKHGITQPPVSSTSRKAEKLHKPEDTKKTSVLSAAPQKKQKLVQNSVASEKHGVAKLPGGSTTNQAGKMPEAFQKSCAVYATRKRKRELGASEKNGLSSFVCCNNAKVLGKISLKTRGSARKKEYACVSVWQNIYESEGSSGSAEPLVNKRTERRKRERERLSQITCARSRKRYTSEASIKAQPPEEVSSQQAKPLSECLEIVVIDPAVQVVTEAPRDLSQPPAQCLDIVVNPPSDQVITQAPRDQSQPPVPCLDIVVAPPVGQARTQAPGAPQQLNMYGVPNSDFSSGRPSFVAAPTEPTSGSLRRTYVEPRGM